MSVAIGASTISTCAGVAIGYYVSVSSVRQPLVEAFSCDNINLAKTLILEGYSIKEAQRFCNVPKWAFLYVESLSDCYNAKIALSRALVKRTNTMRDLSNMIQKYVWETHNKC